MQKLVQEHIKKLSSLKQLKGPYSYKITDVHTGVWRYRRPVVKDESCIACGICVDFCPCGVIEKEADSIKIDYTYCKGCGICVEECPKKAIDFPLESDCNEEVLENGEN